MHKFEIEIKSLLDGKTKADELIEKMKQRDPRLKALGSHKQLNHYFIGGDLKSLFNKIQTFLGDASRKQLEDLAKKAKNFSVRTRNADNKIILVVKATVDDTTSENGTARLEWESVVFPSPSGRGNKGEGSVDDLDKLVLSAGFSYQAKWSREREEFQYHIQPPSPRDGEGPGERLINISVDKNAGYGYLAEFEMVIDDQSKANETKSFIRGLMNELGAQELPQDRLQRMFDHYNKNWRDYYGTDKIFVIE